MESRIEYVKIAPEGAKALYALGRYVKHDGLEPRAAKLGEGAHASQINDCVYCLDLRTKDARPAAVYQGPPASHMRGVDVGLSPWTIDSHLWNVNRQV